MNKDKLHIISHPLVQHKLTIMRDRETSTAKFRDLAREVGMLLGYEVTRDMAIEYVEIETPLQKMNAPMIAGKKLVLVSILRAGNGLLNGMLEILPSARVGHVGLYREPTTKVAVEYYFKMPSDSEGRDFIVVDPMLATGHSAVAAVGRLKILKPRSVRFVCLIASPQGIETFQEEHPDVSIYTASVDEGLNDHGYIIPGIGDAGDRLYGTK